MNTKELKKILEENTGDHLFKDQGKSHPDYIRWAIVAHPDKNGGDTEVFQLLEKRVGESTSGIIISSKNGEYELERTPFAHGDISDIFRFKNQAGLAKIVRQEKRVSLMQNEFDVLSKIRPDPKEFPTSALFLPEIKDGFVLKDKNGPKRRVHILDYNPNLITIRQIIESPKWKNGAEEKTFVWIFRKLLLAMKVAHNAGYIHGAINPDHFMVDKVDHNGRLVGWIHSVPIGEVVTAKTKEKKFYPKEILDGKQVGPETDIYMAGKLGVYLLGGCPSSNNLPRSVFGKIRGFLSALTIENQKYRPNDAIELYENFSSLAESLYGPPKYHKLTGV